MKKIVGFGNNKGGGGKTTCSVNVGALLAARGHRVLIVDGDPQGHVAVMLGAKRRPALYDFMVRGAEPEDVIEYIPADRWMPNGQNAKAGGVLAIIASNRETRSIADYMTDDYHLLRRLTEIRQDFDFVLIDNSPSPSKLHSQFWGASSHVVFCSTAESLSLQGVLDTHASIKKINEERDEKRMPKIEMVGIQFTQVRKNVVEHELNMRDARRRWPELSLPEIQDRIVWAEASSKSKSIFAYDPKSKAVAEITNLVNVLEVGRNVVQAG